MLICFIRTSGSLVQVIKIIRSIVIQSHGFGMKQMQLNDDQEILSVLAMDRRENQQKHENRPLPGWLFAETVRIAIHKRRGPGCAVWFDKPAETAKTTETIAKKAMTHVDYGPEMQFTPRNSFWRRQTNRFLALWWIITLRGTRNAPWSAD